MPRVTPTIRAELATAVRAVNAALSALPASVLGQIDPYDSFEKAAILAEGRDRAMLMIDAWRTEQLARIEQARAEAERDGSRPQAIEADDRRCPVCGADLSERRPDAEVCGPRCRIESSRLRRLLSGETVGPYRCVEDYTERRQRAYKPPHKIDPEPTRTDRARAFLGERCIERPGHVTFGSAIYAAYLVWCEANEPESALSRSAFYRLIDGAAPCEDRLSAPCGGKGRPRLAFRGIVLTRPERAAVGVAP